MGRLRGILFQNGPFKGGSDLCTLSDPVTASFTQTSYLDTMCLFYLFTPLEIFHNFLLYKRIPAICLLFIPNPKPNPPPPPTPFPTSTACLYVNDWPRQARVGLAGKFSASLQRGSGGHHQSGTLRQNTHFFFLPLTASQKSFKFRINQHLKNAISAPKTAKHFFPQVFLQPLVKHITNAQQNN